MVFKISHFSEEYMQRVHKETNIQYLNMIRYNFYCT